MENKRLKVAITQGDTNGVGYEVIFKAFEDPAMLELCTPIIYGAPKVAAYHAKALNMDPQFVVIHRAEDAQHDRLNMLAVIEDEVKVEMGVPTIESAQAARMALDRALADYQKGLFDVLVTVPVHKNTIEGFYGHTNYIERALGGEKTGLTILIDDTLRVALVTNNVAVKDISEALTRQKIVEKGQLLHQALRRDLRISSPRIAVLALNPRCGEDGVLGDEETEIIKPAVDELVSSNIQAFGPYSADDFFGRGEYLRFDAVLAMYHDQGQTPFKALASEEGARLTTGLPLIRTAPSHGPQFRLAGKGKADGISLRMAIYTAIDVWRNRQNYDEPMKNPLPKLYHEKRDESEKVRFNIPRSKESSTNTESEA